jgi:superfamily II DNA or RNA helicase
VVVDAERCRTVAEYFVDAGRVVPGIVVETDGRARSQWWPLPAAGDHLILRSMLEGDEADDHRGAAAALADEVDRVIRSRLIERGASVLAPRRGRRSVAQSWALSLTSAEPWLPESLDGAKVRAFAADVEAWVRSGTVAAARARLALRVVEPDEEDPDPAWRIEVVVQDADEPSLIVTVDDLWLGATPFPPSAREEVLTALGHAVRVAPELASVLDGSMPQDVELDDSALVKLALERTAALEDAGIALLLPSWWTRRGRLGLRAKVKSAGPSGVVTGAAFGLGEMVSFTWEAALGDQRLTAADVRALSLAAEAKRSIVRVRGAWVQVDAKEIDAILRHVGKRGKATGTELLRTGLGLDGVEAPDGAPVVGVEASGALGALLDDALHTAVTPIETPSDFAGRLRPYQERGVGWLSFLGRLGLGACLADDMGLGKTAQLIATMLADRVDGPTLVVCPVSVLGNWANEIKRFAPHLTVLVHHGASRIRGDANAFAEAAREHDVVLTTYSLVARDLEMLEQAPFARLVLDEAQQIKNPATAQSKAAARLQASRRIALTGTPVENRLSELWALMQVLNPGLLGSLRSFVQRYATPIERDHDEEATATLRRVTTPFILRRVKTDRTVVDDLPDKIELTEHCPLTKEQVTLYKAVVDELLDAATNTEGIERRGVVLAGITKLKQVCNHPAQFLHDGSALHARSGKLTRVEELLDEIVDVGDKVLCFTQFAEWGELLRAHFGRRYGFDPLFLHGGVPRRKRDAMVQQFGAEGGAPIFLLSLKAGGTGLNLTAASHVIHLDRWWNPAVEDQATDRAYRIGQKRSVLVHKLVSTGTIEERIDAMIANKRALAERVVGDGEGWLTELSTDELRAVIALRDVEAVDAA